MPTQLLEGSSSISTLREVGKEEDRRVIYRDSDDASYWLTSRGRLGICGYRVEHTVCFAIAGQGTAHPGYGLCSAHESCNPGQFLQLALLPKRTFAEHMQEVDTLPDTDLLNPMMLLKGMHGLMRTFVQKAMTIDGDIEALNLPEIRQLMQDVKGMQQSILEARISIMDLTNSVELVDTIFTSIQRHTSSEVADRIFDDVRETIAPLAGALDPAQTNQPATAMSGRSSF